MRYIMRQKMLSFGDDFQIKDQDGRDVYLVDGKVFSLGKQLSLQDLNGNILLTIKQRLMSWGPAYEILKEGAVLAVVKKELFNLIHYRFSIELPGSTPLLASGNFSDHEYTMSRDDVPLATISKQWFTLTDTYGVEINEGEDDLFLLAVGVVIDMICHPDQK